MNKILVITGEDEAGLITLRALAVEAGLSAYWVHKKRVVQAKTQRRGHGGVKAASATRLGRFLLRLMQEQPTREWHIEKLGELIEEAEYRAQSVSPSLCRLAQEGLVVWVVESTYKLTAAGIAFDAGGKKKLA